MKTLEALQQMFVKRTKGLTCAQRSGVKDVPTIKPIYCADGRLDMSVQASRKHRCWPKTDTGPYTMLEVGFPATPPPESWDKYRTPQTESADYRDSIYAQVPIEMVAEFIDAHGGIAVSVPVTVLPVPRVPASRSALEQRRYKITLEDMGIQEGTL